MPLKQSCQLDGVRQGPPGDRQFRILVFLGALKEEAWVGVPVLSNLGSRCPSHTSVAHILATELCTQCFNACAGSCQSHCAEVKPGRKQSGATRGKSCQCCTACLVAFARVEQEERPVRVMGRCRPASQGVRRVFITEFPCGVKAASCRTTGSCTLDFTLKLIHEPSLSG